MKRSLASLFRRVADMLDAPAALGGPAEGENTLGSTPVQDLFRQYQAVTLTLNTSRAPRAPDEGADALERELVAIMDQLRDQIMATPCVGAGDFAAKAIIDTCRGAAFPDWETGPLWQEARKLTGTED